MVKEIGILGSTGSIGTQALDIIEKHPDLFRVTVLSCEKNVEKLEEQIQKYRPRIAVAGNAKDAAELAVKFPQTEIFWGSEGLKQAAAADVCSVLLNSLMGISGLAPTMEAIASGKDIALANKETLVTGGSLVMDAVRENGVRLLPVDSEHSAIFQCLEGNQGREIKKILLTASGGPFRGFTRSQLEHVTLEQALRHPKWNMGKKITIDSATMMNKGLEVIEARWLFDVPADKIEILVHPQSIVHSMVEFMDTSVIAQLGLPDMRIPIRLALGYPDRISSGEAELDFCSEASPLTFEKPDMQVFRCIKIAYEALEAGGSYPVVMNGANEVLTDLFLKGKISFVQIQDTLEQIMEHHTPLYHLTLEDILNLDREIREYTYTMILG